MVSRQTLYNRRRSVATLQARAPGFVVAYDADRGFVATNAARRLHVAGRFEVVAAWLDGFAAGVAAAHETGTNPA